ncbi:MAG: RNase adapter RapZ, partial [Demequina sp.]
MNDEPDSQKYPSGIPKPSIVTPLVVPEVMVLTGMSGAGRTRAAAVLADLGWYVVDNIPPQLLVEMVAMIARDKEQRLAAVVDVRGGEFFQDFEAVMDHLDSSGVRVRILYLDASDAVLVARYEEARRPHPLQADGTITEGIGRERALMETIRERADHVIDTSSLNVHELADVVIGEVGDHTPAIHVNVQSFGFKYGLPTDADFVADVRFLDNPHWIPELRDLTGLDAPVRSHVLSSAGAQEFLEAYMQVLDTALTHYRAHDKHSVTVAVGCTGGRHRSV